ncbi:MAG: AAA family ATPase, partial [Acidimicrobiia bacterium]|nr:AAA family ATPase [Acidimicrobiia bacterium]
PMITNSRSPHIAYQPEQIEVGFTDVVGLGRVVEEVDHTLRVMLDHQEFREQLGGRPRRGVLFEGPPGTGKTHLAKALAKEAEIPFLFVSATAFQSMWYGMTAKRIKSFFRALRKAARKEGGAIGFIEEIDAIGLKRSGASGNQAFAHSVNQTVSTDSSGQVNELLIQMQSFDEPTTLERVLGRMSDLINLFLPAHRHIRKRKPAYSNVLLIGATNRATSLDPALVRPGRFDRILHFDLPSRQSRLELIDYFLERKSNDPEMSLAKNRDDLASVTMGQTPASIERLFDEALLLALRDGRSALTMQDLRQARTEIEIGLPEPIEYPAEEAETIATHEAGHATVAYLVGKGRKLEMLSIVKRREALGFLAHRLQEERHTQRRSELVALLQIALGGMVAEELFYGESGTGPAGDLASATNIAVEMVGSLGLGDSLISYRALDTGLVGGNLAAKVLADATGREAVDELLKANKRAITKLLGQHRHLVEALRDALLSREELIDAEIVEVIELAEARFAASGGGDKIIDLRGDAPIVTPAKNASDHQAMPDTAEH